MADELSERMMDLSRRSLINGRFRYSRNGRQVEFQAWLTDVLERMVSGRTKAHELEHLLPLTWKAERAAVAVEA
jgi:hypothetical protein